MKQMWLLASRPVLLRVLTMPGVFLDPNAMPHPLKDIINYQLDNKYQHREKDFVSKRVLMTTGETERGRREKERKKRKSNLLEYLRVVPP